MDDAIARTLGALRLAGAFAWSVPLYWLVVFPQARRELGGWQRRARRIPDPVLRAHALRKLQSEALTAEGAAAFAILGTARSCRTVVRACVAFEVIYDYVDALAEEPVPDVLGNNRLLYGTLLAAFTPGAPVEDWYARHPRRDDGDYLRALVETCRAALSRLPSQEHVRPGLLRLARRAGEAQSRHHAAVDRAGERALARWVRTQQPADCPLRWWELAAAASSPLGFFALLAAAAHDTTDAETARLVEQAYFPWIAALSWLLESLVDQEEDAGTDRHSYVRHYGASESAARRLMTIAEHATADARRLPRGGRHLLLLAGMSGMYLSHAGADTSAAREAAEAVRRTIGGPIVPLIWILRARRRAGAATARPGAASARRRCAARRRWRARRSPRRAARRR